MLEEAFPCEELSTFHGVAPLRSLGCLLGDCVGLLRLGPFSKSWTVHRHGAFHIGSELFGLGDSAEAHASGDYKLRSVAATERRKQMRQDLARQRWHARNSSSLR